MILRVTTQIRLVSAAARKLGQVQLLRREGMVSEARDLLYEVLEEGDADQRMVARNILQQLDAD